MLARIITSSRKRNHKQPKFDQIYTDKDDYESYEKQELNLREPIQNQKEEMLRVMED